MKSTNSYNTFVFANKTVKKKTCQDKHLFCNKNDIANGTITKNTNILRTKNLQDTECINKFNVKKIPKLTIDTSLCVKRKFIIKNINKIIPASSSISTISSLVVNSLNKSTNIINKNKKNFVTLHCDKINQKRKSQFKIGKTKINAERTRSGKKGIIPKSTSTSSAAPSSTNDNNKKININLNEKKFQEILKTSKFYIDSKLINDKENNINLNNKNNLRTINDIKKECLATMRASEKVQSRILTEGNQLVNSLEEKYFIFNNKTTTLTLSLQENINNINLGTFSTNFINIQENKTTKNNFTSEEYKQLLNTFNMLEYGQSILDEYFTEQEKTENILEKHTITPEMRMKMVDWMVEIFTIIQANDVTFFCAVNIMDSFFYKSKKEYKPNDLHLIGICSIFIASKFCDINPIKLKFLIEKIGHSKFDKIEIAKMEEIVLTVLEYDVLKPTIYEFTSYYFEDLFYYYENNFNIENDSLKLYLKEFIEKNINDIDISLRRFNHDKCLNISKYTNNLRTFIKCILLYLMKMCCQDYEIINEKKSLVSASCIIVALRICEEVNKDKYIDDFFIERLKVLSRENQYNIMELSSKILLRAQNYEKYYPNIKNLYKTHFESLTKMKNTK